MIYALKNLQQRGLRSGLTILSILIGVMAIYAIVSFGLGMQNYVDSLAEEAGTDKMFLQSRSTGAPGTDSTFSLTRSEIDFVGKIKGVKEYAAMYMKPAEISVDDEERFFFVSAWDLKKNELVLEAFTVEIVDGRQLNNGELGKATLGYLYSQPNKIFKDAMDLGDKFEINGNKFEVVGFYNEIGNPSDDGNVYITNEAYEAIWPESKDLYDFAMIRSEKGYDPEELSEKIEEKLRKKKGQEEGKETFYVQTFADALATFGAVLNVMNGILILIALVSMIVASVNIMNTMYTSVLERTREIGIMKAIGAQNKDILFIFIFESGVLGAVGGAIGVLCGWLIASAGGSFAASAGYSLLKPVFPWYLAAGCIGFAFLVGAVAGVLPARSASKQKPVDALKSDE